MTNAKEGDTVKVHYTGSFEDGTVFDTSEGKEPLEFTVGAGEVIPGFDSAVLGMATGDNKEIQVPMTEAYGPHHDELVLTIEREHIPMESDPVEGMMLQAHLKDGQTVMVQVTDVKDDSITLDANHPLAGKDLTFQITLLEIV